MARKARLLIGITLLWVIAQAGVTTKVSGAQVAVKQGTALSRCDYELPYVAPEVKKPITIRIQL